MRGGSGGGLRGNLFGCGTNDEEDGVGVGGKVWMFDIGGKLNVVEWAVGDKAGVIFPAPIITGANTGSFTACVP